MEIKLILKKIEPFIAISVFIMLLLLVFGIFSHNSLQKEIKENCGYETDRYYCACYDYDNPEAINHQKQLLNKNKVNISEWDL